MVTAMRHILIVEDTADHAFLLQTQLNRLHFLTSVCINTFSILHKVRLGLVDAITVDINLPSINGIELIRYIRNINKNILVVVITALDDDSKRIEALQAGASYYILKPYPMKDLKTIFEPLKNETTD
jgi:DNA-binding response OmpR family regulator